MPDAGAGPTMQQAEAQKSPRRFVDLVVWGPDSGDGLKVPVLVQRLGDPYVLGITYERYLLHPHAVVDPVPVQQGEHRRSIDWDALPKQGLRALAVDAHHLQNNWGRLTQLVNRRGVHIVISRHGPRCAVLVPPDFLTATPPAG